MIKLLTVYLYLNMLCDIYEPDLKLNPPTYGMPSRTNFKQ